jgi:hypothetical protein
MILHLTTALEASGSTDDGWRTPLLAVPFDPRLTWRIGSTSLGWRE